MPDESQVKFLQRLGAREIWGSSFFWFTAGGYAIAAFAYDAIRTGNFDLNWAAIALGTFLEVVLLAWLLIKLFPSTVWGTAISLVFNLAVVFLLGAIKNVSVALIAQVLKLDSNIDWGLRFWGGGLLSLSLLVFFVMTLGSWVEHKAVMTKLELMRAGLDVQRGNATSVVAETEARLTQEATATIFPVLSQIKTLLSKKDFCFAGD
ncbi:MAG: hypothetical protein RL556_257 [Actinomycetota bacterium]|jgi:hypothetical protein